MASRCIFRQGSATNCEQRNKSRERAVASKNSTQQGIMMTSMGTREKRLEGIGSAYVAERFVKNKYVGWSIDLEKEQEV